MATDKPRFLVSRTYDIVTPESARIGDHAESGYEFEDTPMSLAEAIAELRDCSELSSAPIRSPRDLAGHEWASTEPYQDPCNGSDRTESVHIRGLRHTLTPDQLFRLFRLAGLIAH